MDGQWRRAAIAFGGSLLTTVAGVAVAAPTSASASAAITRLSPAGGTTVGGVSVTITGSGFAQVRSVHFGGVAGHNLHVLSATRLTVTTPPHAHGVVSVRVSAAAGTSSPYTHADHFTYRAPLVVLDPGHNGANATHTSIVNRLVPAGYGRRKPCNTTGTATDGGYPEHAFNWDVAKRVRAILAAHHVRVLMTRSTDTGVGPCVNVRARIESTAGVAAAVAIHADGAPSSGHGFHVNEDSRRPVGATRATVSRSTRLGIALHNALQRSSGLVASTYLGRNGYVRRDDLAGLNLSTSPTSFLELGNMRNSGDAARQHSAGGRQRIANAIAAGLLTYLRG